MKEKLVNFKVARLAKEKNFNAPVLSYYTIQKMSAGVQKNDLDILQDINSDFKDQLLWSRPSQSLLQKWLREAHSIDVIVNRKGAIHEPPTGYGVTVYSIQKVLFEYELGISHEFFEDALMIGLYHALKLIKIENGSEKNS